MADFLIPANTQNLDKISQHSDQKISSENDPFDIDIKNVELSHEVPNSQGMPSKFYCATTKYYCTACCGRFTICCEN
jgi:hypothetical protein